MWLRVACFLTGFNRVIADQCGESTRRMILKYFSALILVIIVWAFVSFNFAIRYFRDDTVVACAVALTLIIVVIQIERQIILSGGVNLAAAILRLLIGVLMAFLGAVIIDQVIFSKDIEASKEKYLQSEIDELYESKRRQKTDMIASYQNARDRTQQRVDSLIPLPNTIIMRNVSRGVSYDTAHKELGSYHEVKTVEVPNPAKENLQSEIEYIAKMDHAISRTHGALDSLREKTKTEVVTSGGLLVELKVLARMLLDDTANNWPLRVIWLAVFLFFLLIELFVVANKLFEKDREYQAILDHQVLMKNRRLKELQKDE